MSDEATLSGSHPGSLSPRNTDTLSYRVLKELPVKGIAAVGGTFTAWAQGEVFACVSGLGLGPVKNSEILEWAEAGLIVRETPLTATQERALYAETRAAAAGVAEAAENAPSDGAGRPWPFPQI